MLYALYLLISGLLFMPYLDFFAALHSILPPGQSLLLTLFRRSVKLFMMFSIIPVFYFYFLRIGSKIHKILFIIWFNTLYFFSLIALKLYFNYYQDTPRPSLLFSSSSELWVIKEQIIYQLLRPTDYWLIAFWPIVLVLSFLFIYKKKRDKTPRPIIRYMAVGLTTIYGCYLCFQLLVENPSKRVDYHSTDSIRAYGITLTAAGLFYNSLRDRFSGDSKPIPYPGKISKEAVLGQAPFMPKGTNIIIIQIESLEKSVLDQKINNVEITPFLNRLKKRSIYFDHFYSQHYGGGTSDAEFSALTSLLPVSDHPSFRTLVSGKIESLAYVLHKQGYHSAGFHANYGNFFSRERGFKNLGFDTFYSAKNFSGKAKGFYSSDKEFFRQSLNYIQAIPQPFLAYLITVQSHGPFRNYLPETYSQFHFEETNFNIMEKDYISVIHEVDGAIGELFHLLDRTGLLDRTLVILFADHKSRALNEQPSVDECIPLFIYHKHLSPAINEEIGSHVDISPTVTHLLKVPEGKNWLGSSLLASVQKQTIIRGEDLIYQSNNNQIMVQFDPSKKLYYLFSQYMVH